MGSGNTEMNETDFFMLSEGEQRDLDRYGELRRRGAPAKDLQEAINRLGPNGRRIAKLEDRERGLG